jgi:adenylate cyclase
VACPTCGFDTPPGARFCGSCGQALAQTCATCGTENPSGFRFCGSCGAALGVPEAPPAPVLGERRRVTVLFADLVGFSSLAEHLDPEELNLLVTDTFSELTEEVERRDGTVEKFIGDAIVAIFGAPVAHEDDPVRAVEAARAMLEAVERRAEGSPVPLALRIGVNSGLVVAGPVGDGSQTGVMGDTVNTAARLQQAAEPGELLVAASTWRQVRERFDAEPLGPLDVKGKAQPVEAYRLTARRAPGVRRLSPFVGRREELALLELLWGSVRKGNTHVVSIVGEPGVGKSRLLAELPARANALDVRIACAGDRAYGPFLDLVAALLGRLPESAAELEEAAAPLGLEWEDVVLLGAFLGLGGAPPVVRMADEQRVQQVFAGVWQLVAAASRGRPLLVALDDVHWADESSRSLLGFLLEQLAGIPVMLLLLYRPGFQTHAAELRASHTGIRLEPLTASESVEVARGFLGVTDLPSDLDRLVATRAEGNPFFIEELLQALLELGSLAVVEGRAVLAQVDVDIPDTVQGTILARLDRLEPEARTLLQQAAVLGRSFATRHLELVAGPADVSSKLAELARAQLVAQERPGFWAFKHALIQEVAYDALLLRRRRELHLEVAAALEREAGDDPLLLEALATHYARAEEREKARAYAVAAGDVARDRMGYVEATRRYQTALRLWGDGDEQGRLELLTKLGEAALTAADGPAARAALLEAADGWQQLGEPRRAGAALAVLGRVYWLSGEAARAGQVLDQAIATLEPIGPSEELARAYAWASTLRMLEADVEASIPLAKRGLALAEQLGLDGYRANLLNTLGGSQVFAGDPTGIERIREALTIAHAAGDPEAIGRAYVNLGSVLSGFGRDREAIEIDRKGREVMRELGAPGFEWFIAGNQASALLALGRLDEAFALAGEVLEVQRSMTAVPGTVNAGVTQVDCLTRQGDYDRAQAILADILPLARGLGSAEYLGMVLEVVARLEHARGNLAAARQCVREASDLVASTSAWEMWLRLMPTAARLLPADEARALLERIPPVPPSAMSDARLAEALALVSGGDRERSRHAADLYRDLELPFEEAQCRIDAGELDRAREIAERFGFGAGPLGAALAAAGAG